jgi:hypothetical protein
MPNTRNWERPSPNHRLVKPATCARIAAIGALTLSSLMLNAPAAVHAGRGSWTQAAWTTPTSTLAAAASDTNLFFRPGSLPTDGQLAGTFGVCAGPGIWCQVPDDVAPGQALRLSGNHRSDGGNPWSSDLNGDGVSELLVANWWDNASTHAFSGGWVYWGQGTPAAPRWRADGRTELSTLGAHGMVAADLNGDGWPEVIVSNFRDDRTRNVSSYIHWGRPGGAHGVTYGPATRTELPAPGAHGIAVADLNKDGRPEVIFTKSNDDDTHKIDSYIYWGQAGGVYGVTYNPAALTRLPTQGAHGVAVADLNGDGWPELVFANKFDGSIFAINSYIYWARPGGQYGVTYDPTARTELPTLGAFGVAVADLNGDGRPELVFANWSDGSTLTVNSYAYWARPGGQYGVNYSPSARTELPGIGAMKVSVAHLDDDDQLDIVVQNYDGGFTRVFWGPLPISGTATNYWTVNQVFGFRGLSLSDLNQDGRVDLLTSRQGIDPNPVGSYWQGGAVAQVYLHSGRGRAPYAATPDFSLPALSPASIYASFGPHRGTNGEWFSQPRPVYRTSFAGFGVLESVVMDSGRRGTAWTNAQADAAIAPGTGITLFVAAGDTLSALSDPRWVQVGAMRDGSWSQDLGKLRGRYARYRVVLWRDHTTEASPALRRLTFNYEGTP